MDGNTMQVAREWARAGIRDGQIAATLATNHRALVLQSMAPGGLSSVTNATKNGVSMGKSMGLSVPDTLTAMSQAIEWIDLGYVPCQSRSYARF